MGKGLLLAIAAISMSSAYYALQAREGMRHASEKVADHQYEVLSREAALTGFTLAKQLLSESFSSHDISGHTDNGRYATGVVVSGTDAEMESIGETTGPDGKPVTYQILARFRQVPGALADRPPAFMRYAVASEENINLNGSILTEIYVQGEESSELNANMHTNGNMHIEGTKVHVEGFGTFLGSGTSNPGKALQEAFDPHYNPNGDPGAQQVLEPLDIPSFDMSLMSSELTFDQTSTGDVVLSGDYTLGTRDDPYVWNVTGNLQAAGNVTINGYVMFVVEGNVQLTGNLLAGDSGWTGADESSIAMYVGGNADISGNIEVYGQFLVDGTIRLEGNPTIFGSVVTDKDVVIQGSPEIYYRVPSVALTTPWQERKLRLRMVAYSEW
jgi:cytoskeletal protein CcmA (bactofilin family)